MDVSVTAGRLRLEGMLELPPAARAVVAFAHGSGSGRNSPRNRFVAAELNKAGLGTLLLDLLTVEEDRHVEMRSGIAAATRHGSRATSPAATRSALRLQPGLDL